MNEFFNIFNNKKILIVSKSRTMRFFFIIIGFLFATGLSQSCKEKQLTEKKGLNRKELIAEVKKLYFDDQKDRRIIGVLEDECVPDSLLRSPHLLDKETQLAVDVIYQQQSAIDDKNTERLIRLTKKYGFPGMKHLNHDVPVFLVFVHSKIKFYKEVRELIKKEYQAGRVSKFERDFIFWNLNGSKGIPPPIPHPINYRKDIEIFKGALSDDG